MAEFEFTDFSLLPAIVEALDAAGVDDGLALPRDRDREPGAGP